MSDTDLQRALKAQGAAADEVADEAGEASEAEGIAAAALAAKHGVGSSQLAKVDDAGLAVLATSDVELALELLDDAGLGGDNLTGINGADEELGDSMPILKIQQQAVEDLEVGWLTHSITGMQYEDVRVVLLALRFSRQWLLPFDGDARLKVVCSSSDGKNADYDPDRSEPATGKPDVGASCADCPHSKWVGTTPPVCSELYPMLLFLPDEEDVVVFLARRTAVKPLRQARQRVKAYGGRAKRKLGKAGARIPSNLLVSFRFGTKYAGGGARRDYYFPEFGPFNDVPVEELPMVLGAASLLAPQFAELRAEEVEKATDVFDEAIDARRSASAEQPEQEPSGGDGPGFDPEEY